MALAFELDLEPHQRYVCRMPDPRIIKTYPRDQARLEKARTRCAARAAVEQKPRLIVRRQRTSSAPQDETRKENYFIFFARNSCVRSTPARASFL